MSRKAYSSKINRRSVARHTEHGAMKAALIAFLDGKWPLWRQHEGESRHQDLTAAFEAGWRARADSSKRGAR